MPDIDLAAKALFEKRQVTARLLNSAQMAYAGLTLPVQQELELAVMGLTFLLTLKKIIY